MTCNICHIPRSSYILSRPNEKIVFCVCDECSKAFFGERFSSEAICSKYAEDPKKYQARFETEQIRRA